MPLGSGMPHLPDPMRRGEEMTEQKSPKPGISRRGFLKATAAVAGASALAGGGLH